MPELPEVETTRRGIEPWCVGQSVDRVSVWQDSLRWPIPADLPARASGQILVGVRRRGKYLLLDLTTDTLIIHLGMSGSLRIVQHGTPRRKHDHWEIHLASGNCLRYHDPRRFGALLLCPSDQLTRHPLLQSLGLEPLEDEFDGDYLFRRSRGRRTTAKQFIMDSHLVVGVGNIYASESLFLAGIHPARPAGNISRERYLRLAEAIRQVLGHAIACGGTTLRDYVNGSGQPGYFSLQLEVYGRTGLPCSGCKRPIRVLSLGQRSTFYCPRCQR